jgi:hypothetical protein
MKTGIRIKIDVTKIDKARLFEGKSGAKYLDATVFMDPDNPGDYGDHGFISQDVSKEERDQGVKGPIIGNVKVFWTGESQPQQAAPQATPQAPPPAADFDDSDIPF